MRPLVFILLLLFGVFTFSSCQRDKRNYSEIPNIDSALLIREVFKDRTEHSISDIGGVFRSDTGYFEYHPGNIEPIAVVAAYCAKHHIKIRVRGRGHSMNGSSLPRQDELFLVTDRLRKYRYVNDSVVEVEAGASMHAISNWLKQYGYELPVINDGGPGPSLGGYISAGGISDRSHRFGGFWENVEEITLVDGTGKIRNIAKQDSVFKWLFGSSGQLGIFVKAKLRIIPLKGATQSKLPLKGSIGEEWGLLSYGAHTSHNFVYPGEKIVFWLNIYAPWNDKDETMEFSHGVRVQNQERTILQPDCIWKIKNIHFVPPLIYPVSTDLICIGVWGYIPVNQGSDEARNYLINMESGFMKQIMADRKYRRYIQTEIVAKDVNYRDYLGPEIYDAFKQLKQTYDPQSILNNGYFKQ